jgi:hypothetical protein
VRTGSIGLEVRRSYGDDPTGLPPCSLEDYSDSVGPVRNLLGELDGHQPNDPALAARAIIHATDEDEPPLWLPLGEEAFAGIRQHLQHRAEELNRSVPLGGAIGFALSES